jgi:hypothetical protein
MISSGISRAPEWIVSIGVDSEGEIGPIGFDRGPVDRIDAAGADLEIAIELPNPPRRLEALHLVSERDVTTKDTKNTGDQGDRSEIPIL